MIQTQQGISVTKK